CRRRGGSRCCPWSVSRCRRQSLSSAASPWGMSVPLEQFPVHRRDVLVRVAVAVAVHQVVDRAARGRDLHHLQAAVDPVLLDHVTIAGDGAGDLRVLQHQGGILGGGRDRGAGAQQQGGDGGGGKGGAHVRTPVGRTRSAYAARVQAAVQVESIG